jgi:cell filamentation protein
MNVLIDPYVYPGTIVLKNKFGIRNQSELDDIEANLFSIKMHDLCKTSFIGEYDCSYLQFLHKYIFEDLYEWAGEIRIINLEKSESVLGGLSIEYCQHNNIISTFNSIANQMKNTKLENLSLEERASKFSYFLALLWQVHPFREGNTRMVTHFCCQYLRSLNIPIDNQLFKQHSGYFRNALVAARSIFSDLGDISQPEHLYKIVLDAMRRPLASLKAAKNKSQTLSPKMRPR